MTAFELLLLGDRINEGVIFKKSYAKLGQWRTGIRSYDCNLQELGTTHKAADGTWTAQVGFDWWNQPASTVDYEPEWRRSNAPTFQNGFRTRREAGAWLLKRSQVFGILFYERLRHLTPLEALAECAEEENL